MTDYTIVVVRDAVRVLDSFCNEQKGLTLTETVAKTGLGKNKVFRILHTLEQSRMVYRDGNQRFHLGFRVTEMADNVHQHHLLRDISEPIMAELLQKTQESIFLGVPAGHNALCIAALESTRSMRLYARVGILSPLYVGGAPKVLLANMTESKRERHLDYFEDTVTDQAVDWEELRRKLARIRHQGYGITIDELDLGAHSVSAPVFEASGQVIAGMSIAFPSIRFDDGNMKRYIELVTGATLRISTLLGYNPRQDVGTATEKEIVSELI